jgi:hypothetical protein
VTRTSHRQRSAFLGSIFLFKREQKALEFRHRICSAL